MTRRPGDGRGASRSRLARFSSARRRRVAPLVVAAALAAVVVAGAGTGSAGPASAGPPADHGTVAAVEPLWLAEGDAPPVERLRPGSLPEPPDLPAPSVLAALADEIPAPAGLAVDFRDYATPREIEIFLSELAERRPDLVTVSRLGTSSNGRPILTARVTNSSAPGDVDDRPAMYVDGQHHGRELISSQVALYTLWWLVDRHGSDPLVTHLLDTRVLHVVPSVNPDANAMALADDQTLRKTAGPLTCDDDGDGSFDEDGARGYGYGTHELTRYHFDRSWAAGHPDDPFVADWPNHLDRSRETEELGPHTGALGGPILPVPRQDDDGDRRFDEDEPGGTDPNRNYDFAWDDGDQRCRSVEYRGESAFSEPETRAVRDLAASVPHLATALSYHSGADIILHPWGFSPDAGLPDEWLYERLGRKGSQLTAADGFQGSPHGFTARGLYPAAGSTMDYLYGRLGVVTLSPELYRGSPRTYLARLGSTATYTLGLSTGALFNPAPDGILPVADRWHRFALYLLAATPNVELRELRRDGDDVVFELVNDGALPVDVEVELAGPGVAGATAGPFRLWADEPSATWRVPAAPAGATLTLSAVARLVVGTVPHEVERASWRIAMALDGTPTVVGGLPAPVDPGSLLPGGWWAGPEWDVPDLYHLPGGHRLPTAPTATPSAVPTATATADPTATPTAATATVGPSAGTPTADATAGTATATAMPTVATATGTADLSATPAATRSGEPTRSPDATAPATAEGTETPAPAASPTPSRPPRLPRTTFLPRLYPGGIR